MSKKDARPEARLPKGLFDTSAGEIRATGRCSPRSCAYSSLRLRAAGHAGHRIYRRARQVPARPGPAERGRVLLQGRRRAMAVAALRSDRAARPLRGGEFPEPAQALPPLSGRPVWRNEKPGPGRFRQFTQFDADTVGASSVAADAELCMLAADTLEALGIPRGQYVIKVNNRKVLDGVLEFIGLGGEANASKRLAVLRAIDKMDRLGINGVTLLLGPGRRRKWRFHERGRIGCRANRRLTSLFGN